MCGSHEDFSLVSATIGLANFVANAPGAGAQSTLEKLRVTYSAIGGSQASVWIPYEAGMFRKHGLDVELLYVDGRFFQELDKEGFIQRLWK